MSLRIRILVTREYVYSPELDNDEFYEGCSTLEEAIEADKKWIEKNNGDYEDLSDDKGTISKVAWQIYNDDTGEVVQEV